MKLIGESLYFNYLILFYYSLKMDVKIIVIILKYFLCKGFI